MQEVYNKTMAMLFRGTKNLANNNAESNMGVLKEKNMQEVYNKTMAMLYRGTKNLANNNAFAVEEQAGECKPSHDKVVYKQLSLTPLGGVTSCSSTSGENPSCSSCVRDDCVTQGSVCGSCGGMVGGRCVRHCEVCGVTACGVCDSVRSCQGCNSLFCCACSQLSRIS